MSHPFEQTGSGGDSAFQPLNGDPKLEKSYFSWIVNQKPALTGMALKATIARIRAVYGQRLGIAPGPRSVTQLDTNEKLYFSSDSPEWLDFQNSVREDLAKLPLAGKGKYGFTGTGLGRGPEKLATHGGIAMTPSLSPHMANIGKPLGELPSEYMHVLRLLTEIYTESWTPAGITANNKSHFGILKDTYSKDEKIDFCINEVINRFGSEFAERFVNIDGDWFTQHFGAYPCCTPTPRFQLDALGKVRAGFNYLGEDITASDKSVPAEMAHGYKEMVALRQRVAYAVDGTSNFMLSPVWAGFRKAALNEYYLSWHTSFDDDLTKPVERYGNYRLYDAANFDTTYSREEIDHIIDSCLWVTDLAKSYQKRLSHLPIVIKSDIRGEAGAFLFNNSEYRAGHQSGVCYVSDFNKIRGSAHWIYGLYKIGALSYKDDIEMKREIRRILRHEDDRFALVNQGDDTLALAATDKLVADWCRALEEMDFAVWEPDDGRKMLGKVFYQSTVNSPLRIIPDAMTLLEKLLINERSVHSKHRSMSSAGNLVRLDMLEGHPAGGAIIPILDKHAQRIFGDKLRNLYRQTLYKDGEATVGSINAIGLTDVKLSMLNAETREYLINPDAIHYKIDKDKVDPIIFNALNSAVEAEDAAWIIRRMKFMDPKAHESLNPQSDDHNGRYKLKQSRGVTWH